MSNPIKKPLMTDAQDYYEQVLALGHPPEHALVYTRQHFPDFVPGVSASMASPQPTLDVEEAEPSPAKAYAAVALLLIGALFSVAASFNHDWIAINEIEDENPLGLSAGLTTIRADCAEAMPYNGNSQANATEQCKAIAYVWFADAMETAAAENRSADDLDDVFVSSHENYCNNIEMLWNNNRPIGSSYDEFSPSEFALISSNTICRNVGYYADSPASKEDLPPLDESLTGVIHVLGSVVALLGSGLLAAAAAGRELPGNIEREGKWVSFAAMVVIITAVLVFAMDANSHLFGTKMGTGQIMALLSGVFSMCATVLSFLVKK